jgi:hypothetical protein
MRLSAPELFVGVLVVAAGFAFGFAVVAAAIPSLIVVGVLAALHAAIAAVFAAILAMILLIVALVWCALRLSGVPAMMVSDNQFHLFDAWTLTRGHSGSLFLVGLCLVAIVWAIDICVLIVGLIVVGVTVGLPTGGPEGLRSLALAGPGALFARAAPGLAVMAVVGVFILGALRAIVVAPWARAFVDISAQSEIVAAAPQVPPGAPAPGLSGA